MLNIAAVMQAMCDSITAQGVRCVLDERDLNPPGALVRAPELNWRFGQGRYDAEWTVLVCVENAGRNVALGKLGPLIESAAKGIGVAVLAGRPVDVQLPDSAAPVPGYELTFNTKIVA